MIQIKDVKNLSAHEVRAGQLAGEILIVDVREPGEFAAERIPGAISHPLSTFNPASLRTSVDEISVVFQCGSGVRSLKAIRACREAGIMVDSHLAGGIGGWKACGLPTERHPLQNATR
ncbi:rhodanese-like domain-containing protein [uncultured Brevundimonas sp.]|uniref:rhodanese-like domain-containing protein n=1 Tax=uncultured Brevundimonas sp. TaxID=213418 RepID=UPI0030EC3B56|tara:strand:- start:4167 stop:4520 length:354 start_codon:yes stop_codon:yes gene_type:complete